MELKKEILKEIMRQPDKTFIANDFVDLLGVKRNAISHYLNRLVDEKKLKKYYGRPVRFQLSSDELTAKVENDVFESFIGYEGSLKEVIESCQAAVKYPPAGLPILLKGESGVGKSFLAQLIYQYSQQQQIIQENAPFLVLNCADYANNPELLSGILFGYKKGAFTGATDEYEGLLKKADGGYLFLDEVHRLSSENQEKLFLFMDQKFFSKLGDNTQKIYANVRLIFATTENIETVLLTTFKRRIPLKATILPYRERPIRERQDLLYHFFQREAEQLEKEITLSPNVVETFLLADTVENLGGIRNAIQIACANAFSKQENENPLKIDTPLLPQEWQNKKEKTTRLSTDWLSIPLVTGVFAENKYIELGLEKEQIAGKTLIEINQEFLEIKKRYIRFLKETTENIVQYNLLFWYKLQSELTQIATHYGIVFDEVEKKSIFLFLVQSISFEFPEISAKMSSELQKKYRKSDYLAAKIIENIALIDASEKNEKKMLLTLFLKEKIHSEDQIACITLAHGENTAASISEVVNQLLGDYIFEAADLKIDATNGEIIETVKAYIRRSNTQNGLLLIVDMGSLEQMYDSIKEEFQGELLIINYLSTPLALDIGMQVSQGKKIPEIIQHSEARHKIVFHYYQGLSKGKNIIVSSILGREISLKIKEIFTPYFEKHAVDILTLDFLELKRVLANEPELFEQTLFLLTTTDVASEQIKIINVEDLISGGTNANFFNQFMSVDDFYQLSNDLIRFFSIEGASERLSFLNPKVVIAEMETVIGHLEEHYQIRLENFIRLNLLMHLSMMLERLLTNQEVEGLGVEATEKNAAFVAYFSKIFQPIVQKYHIVLPKVEVLIIHEIIQSYIG